MLAQLLTRGTTMKRLSIAVLTTLLLALTGCSGDSTASDPTSRPISESPAASATASPSASSGPAVPMNECLTGRYRLVRFVGAGERGTYGTGEGGDVTVRFDDGSYLLSGAGKEPIKLTLAGQTAGLLVDGRISGNSSRSGRAAALPPSPSAR
jgi:hypothetical protein